MRGVTLGVGVTIGLRNLADGDGLAGGVTFVSGGITMRADGVHTGAGEGLGIRRLRGRGVGVGVIFTGVGVGVVPTKMRWKSEGFLGFGVGEGEGEGEKNGLARRIRGLGVCAGDSPGLAPGTGVASAAAAETSVGDVL